MTVPQKLATPLVSRVRSGSEAQEGVAYPTSLNIREVLQIDVHHPLLRKGIVAGENVQTRGWHPTPNEAEAAQA